MIYRCENDTCGFLFKRSGDVETCPVCGSTRIRQADGREQAEYEERREAGEHALPTT
jgi:uncharacterized Zn finger protein (UPF0148 family)